MSNIRDDLYLLTGAYFSEIGQTDEELNDAYNRVLSQSKEWCKKEDVDYTDNLEIIFDKFDKQLKKYLSEEFKEHISAPSIITIEYLSDFDSKKTKINDLSSAKDLTNFYKIIGISYHRLLQDYLADPTYINSLLKIKEKNDIEILELDEEVTISFSDSAISYQELSDDELALFDNYFDYDFDLESGEEFNRENSPLKEEILDEETVISNLKEYTEFILVLPHLSKQYANIREIISKMYNIEKEKTIEEFNKNQDFINQIYELITHDSEKFDYYYHGTTCKEDAEKIIEQGLATYRDDVTSTAYIELDINQILTYNRGFGGEIGEQIVVFAFPKNTNEIRTMTSKERESIKVIPSGLQGLDITYDYIVPREYMIGYIDKKDQTVHHVDPNIKSEHIHK